VRSLGIPALQGGEVQPARRDIIGYLVVWFYWGVETGP
jgi:hypothetical protein